MFGASSGLVCLSSPPAVIVRPLRFIHAADIHLDSPLRGLSGYDGAPVEPLRTATRRAFESLVDRAIAEKVAFVVVAGDVFDGLWRDYNTGLYFAAQMGRLRRESIRVVVCHGNHDAESELTCELRRPDNVFAFEAQRATTIRFEDLRVAFHGQSFRQRAVTENLAAHYPERVAGWLNIGVLHTALTGRVGHEPYAPCTVEDLCARGYEYFALGHVHQFEVVREAPWIVFPGNLQGRSVRETGPRGAVLVEAEGDAIVSVVRVILDVLRWEHVFVDVEGCSSVRDVCACGERELSRVVEVAGDIPVAVRMTFRGRSPLHGELFGGVLGVRAELQAAANAFGPGRAWVESVRLETEPAWSAAEIDARGDAVAELRAVLDEAPNDPDLVRALEAELAEMAAKLEPDVRTANEPMLAAIREGRVGDIMRAVASSLVSRVSGK
jgi:DNA repair exonuclease SbcCD nuclease subunit